MAIIDFVSQRDTEKHLSQAAAECGNSSVGRASPCQGGGREFESRFPLHIVCKFDVKLGPIAQLVRATGS